jgi:hypothetical protein
MQQMQQLAQVVRFRHIGEGRRVSGIFGRSRSAAVLTQTLATRLICSIAMT